MNRQEFCELMAQAKKRSGIGTKELSLRIQQPPTIIRRFERGLNNFNLAKVVEYLQVINSKLVVCNSEETISFYDYEHIIEWVKKTRTGKYSQRALADAIGCSFVHVAHFESKKSILSIDIFLRIIELFGYSISIITNG